MVQAPQDPAEVADAVAVGVLERTRIDLVDDGSRPPGRDGGGGQDDGPTEDGPTEDGPTEDGPTEDGQVWCTASTLLPSGSRKKTA
jgi:hypothetical protein